MEEQNTLPAKSWVGPRAGLGRVVKKRRKSGPIGNKTQISVLPSLNSANLVYLDSVYGDNWGKVYGGKLRSRNYRSLKAQCYVQNKLKSIIGWE
jgi:hypothetical protein